MTAKTFYRIEGLFVANDDMDYQWREWGTRPTLKHAQELKATFEGYSSAFMYKYRIVMVIEFAHIIEENGDNEILN